MNKQDLKKINLLITIVPYGKKEVIKDLLEEFDVNFSLSLKGYGTGSHMILEVLGIKSNERDIVLSFIRKEKTNDAILSLEDKFKKFNYNQSIAFSLDLSSIIGMQNYLFLSNQGGDLIGK